MNTRPLLLAIVGGSGSGKTWLAEHLARALGPNAVRLSQDDFYQDRSRLPEQRRAAINFDHPRAIDWKTLEAALRELLEGRSAETPIYNFRTHCRENHTRTVHPAPILLMDGLWLLRRPSLRRLFDVKVFIDCPAHTRLRRRIERDVVLRGRTRMSVEKQFNETVEPMHREFVEPQRRWADIILPHDFTEHEVAELANRAAAAVNLPGKVRSKDERMPNGGVEHRTLNMEC